MDNGGGDDADADEMMMMRTIIMTVYLSVFEELYEGARDEELICRGTVRIPARKEDKNKSNGRNKETKQ